MDLTFAEISTFPFAYQGNLKAIMINWIGILCAGVQHDNHWLSLLGIDGKTVFKQMPKTGEAYA